MDAKIAFLPMKPKEYDRLCKRAEEDFAREREEAENRYKSRLAALKWALGPTAKTDGSPKHAHKVDHGFLISAIEGALPMLPDKFRVSDVIGRIDGDGLNGSKKASISSALKRMADDGVCIHCIEKGKGRRETTFGKGSKHSETNAT